MMCCPNSIGKTNNPVTPSNFLGVCCAFTARKLVDNTWINHFDEYLAPDTTNPNFHQFEVDSVVYSLFHSSSQQSSLRQIDYKGKKWDIKNAWFFMSRSEIANLANENKLDETYEQATMEKSETFVYDFLTKHESEFSTEAKAVLDAAQELVRKSFKYRELYNMEHPKAQVLNWDCGWYQCKLILKEYAKDDLAKFKVIYKKLSEKLLPQVYNLGFLRK